MNTSSILDGLFIWIVTKILAVKQAEEIGKFSLNENYLQLETTSGVVPPGIEADDLVNKTATMLSTVMSGLGFAKIWSSLESVSGRNQEVPEYEAELHTMLLQ